MFDLLTSAEADDRRNVFDIPFSRSAIVAGYVGLALTFSFAFGGGLIVLLFFCVWGLVWLGFSLFWRSADEARRRIVQRPSSTRTG